MDSLNLNWVDGLCWRWRVLKMSGHCCRGLLLNDLLYELIFLLSSVILFNVQFGQVSFDHSERVLRAEKCLLLME